MKHLAQINIARFLYQPEDPRVADFMNNLDRVNAIADRSDGFVWRLQTEDGNATSLRPYGDPDLLINMSVWETPEALEKFVWQTVHKRFYSRKHEWIAPMKDSYFAMWWVDAGHIPSVEEGMARLDHLREHGASDHAFGWDALASSTVWRDAQCG